MVDVTWVGGQTLTASLTIAAIVKGNVTLTAPPEPGTIFTGQVYINTPLVIDSLTVDWDVTNPMPTVETGLIKIGPKGAGTVIGTVDLNGHNASPQLEGIEGNGYTLHGGTIQGVVDGFHFNGTTTTPTLIDTATAPGQIVSLSPKNGWPAGTSGLQSDGTAHCDSVQFAAGSNITIQGWYLEGGDNSCVMAGSAYAPGVAGSLANILIEGCHLGSNGSAAVNLTMSAGNDLSGVTIRDCTIEDRSKLKTFEILRGAGTNAHGSNNLHPDGTPARVQLISGAATTLAA